MCGILVYSGLQNELDHFEKNLKKIVHRGPDNLNIYTNGIGVIAFHRLRIMDPSPNGDQPFVCPRTQNMSVCNGEIYNFRELQKKVELEFKSNSDCEVLLPLYEKYGLIKTALMLDAEYAFVIWDHQKRVFVAGRDQLGIRPLFYGHTIKDNRLIFASEAKAIADYCYIVKPFPPGHVYDGEKFICYHDISKTNGRLHTDRDAVLLNIKELLKKAVKKRLVSDSPVGFLLSGGLDSSLVCAIAQRYLNTPIKTFAVGMESDAIDLKYARDVAKYIGADHTEVIITSKDVMNALRKVIWHLESYDITTIRASIGMYLVCKHIHENSSIKVLLTGEVSDELFGYKYTDFAPSAAEFQKEAQKRISEIYMYDVLRADRCISAHALEARVPFSDKAFVEFVMHIDPELKMNKNSIGKYLLRAAFEKEKLLPEHILWREKAAFSDAVGHSLADSIKEYAEKKYSDYDLDRARLRYEHSSPVSKESLLYRDIFEELFPGKSKLIPGFWLPNQNWKNCNVTDPSARVLPNYGQSGN